MTMVAGFPSKRLPAVSLLIAATLAASIGVANAQMPAITVGPPPGSGLALDTTPGSPNQNAGTPPSLQQYSLWDRIFGSGGAIFPGYVPPIDNRARGSISHVTGGGDGSPLVFAAGSVDSRCQMAQAPTIRVMTPPQGVTLNINLGSFTARAIDAGTTYCVGRRVGGMRVTWSGKPPRGGTTATLRVSYPPSVRSYTHVINIP